MHSPGLHGKSRPTRNPVKETGDLVDCSHPPPPECKLAMHSPGLQGESRPTRSMVKDNYAEKAAMEGMFPTAFTSISGILFVIPMWICIETCLNPAFYYWFDYADFVFWMLMTIPVLFLVTHVLHSIYGRPIKYVAISVVSFSCVTIGAIAQEHRFVASDLEYRLYSSDCNTFHAKRILEQAWQDANVFYMACVHETVHTHNMSQAFILNNYRIQQCGGYEEVLQLHAKEWEYLEYLEKNYDCSGWCNFHHQLWTMGTSANSCTTSLSAYFRFKILVRNAQVIIAMLLTFFIGFFALVVGESYLQ